MTFRDSFRNDNFGIVDEEEHGNSAASSSSNSASENAAGGGKRDPWRLRVDITRARDPITPFGPPLSIWRWRKVPLAGREHRLYVMRRRMSTGAIMTSRGENLRENLADRRHSVRKFQSTTLVFPFF